MRRLVRLAERMGLSVRIATLPGDLTGFFVRENRAIYLSRDTGFETRAITLAHELGHAMLEHPDEPTDEHEAAADAYAIGLFELMGEERLMHKVRETSVSEDPHLGEGDVFGAHRWLGVSCPDPDDA